MNRETTRRSMQRMSASLILFIGLNFAGGLNAQEPQPPKEVVSLIEEFTKEAAKIRDPRIKTLRAEGSKIVAKLLREASNDAAKEAGAQIEAKIAGEQIETVNPELLRLFELYDRSLGAELKPLQDKYSKRMDAMIKSVEGKDLRMVMALAEAKKLIEQGGPPPSVSGSGAAVGESKKGRYDPTGQTWGFSPGSTGTSYTFLKNGAGERTDKGVKQPFTWKANSKGQIELQGNSFRPRILVIDASGTQADIIVRDTGEKTMTAVLFK